LVLGGVGVVSLGVGSYFGLRAISKNDEAKQFCKDGGSTCQDPRGESLTNSAESFAHLANGFVIGGGVLAATGVIVYLTAPSADSARVGVVTDGHGSRLTVRGAF
jgi:serine/threonine-protein kinase